MEEYKKLLEPLPVGNIILKNRMLSAPTSLAELGANERYSRENIDYYRLKASGGCSLVTVGDVIVEGSTGKSHPQQVSIDDIGNKPYFIELCDASRYFSNARRKFQFGKRNKKICQYSRMHRGGFFGY